MLLIAIFIALATQIRAQCAPGCDFALCDGGTALNAGSADKPLTGPLCTSMGDKVQAIASTGEALVDGEAPISKFIPEGLLQQFSTSFFKAYGDKIGHEMPQQNQAQFLSNICVKIPLVSYTLQNGSVNISTNSSSSCIALTVQLSATAATPTTTATESQTAIENTPTEPVITTSQPTGSILTPEENGDTSSTLGGVNSQNEGTQSAQHNTDSMAGDTIVMSTAVPWGSLPPIPSLPPLSEGSNPSMPTENSMSPAPSFSSIGSPI